jgi:peptide/nickel transport system permease protein
LGNIGQYMIRRVLLLIPLLIGLSLVMFLLIHLAPGDPVRAFVSQPNVDPAFIAQARHNLGLDQPLPVQYARYMGRLVRGDFGTAYTFNSKPVLSLIKSRVAATVILQGISLAIALLIAIPLGILSATKQYSFLDNTTTVGSFIGLAIPNFWLALLLQLYLSVKFHWLPTISTGQAQAPFPARIKYFVMPVIVLALPSIAYFARFMRSAMLEVMRQDYIRTARAKGASERSVNYHHALRNAILPVITVIGIEAAFLMGGLIVTETVFNIPGVARFLVEAIKWRDYPIVQNLVMFVAVVAVTVNFIVDVLYAVLDPRIKYA